MGLGLQAAGRDTSFAVAGAASMPGPSGGTATVTANVNRSWILALYLGVVTVTDTSAPMNLKHLVLFGKGRSMSPNIAVMTSTSANYAAWPWGQNHAMEWTIHDLT